MSELLKMMGLKKTASASTDDYDSGEEVSDDPAPVTPFD